MYAEIQTQQITARSTPLIALCSGRMQQGTSAPLIFIIMGVSGCGKSTVGQALARRLQCAFYDADNYHPETNISEFPLCPANECYEASPSRLQLTNACGHRQDAGWSQSDR